MDLSRQRVIPVYIEDKMKSSYLDYSMSVIVSRALPDVRDGLKPVHRRILLAMNDLNLAHNKQYRKSAKLTGDVSGNYHPHGTASVYGAVVRLAQDFSMRYPLIDGQGNFGSIDGDAAAAERYTEVRMEAIAEELLADIDKETVEFGPNYDETRQMALVLPSRVPNLLINGASGIAVGMATNIPPHNLTEITNALKALLDDPEISDNKLYRHVQGPDFPTGGIIYGRSGISDAYRTGRGLITLRARANIETQKGGKTSIVISEIPYQTNKSAIIEKVAELVRAGKLSGISDIRDESDKEGLRIVVDLKRDAYPKVVLSHLFKHTGLQVTFGIIMLALNRLRPEVMSLRQMMAYYLEHREEVITRRTRFDLARAEERAHILEGYKIALDNIDEIIKLIKKSASPAEAKNAMMKKFALSDLQAQAILDMKLQRLTGLERKKIEDEYLALIQKIAYFKSILENRNMLLELIREELEELKEKYGDGRRTEILDADGEVNLEDLIAEEEMIITVTHSGYIKRIPVGTYKRQKRGGKGITGMGMKDEDFVEQMFIASTHSYILFFTNTGKCFRLKVHEIPQGGRLARGKAMVNFFPMSQDENITELIPVSDFDNGDYLVMVTRQGIVKKTELSAYSKVHSGGLIAIKLREGDNLVRAKLTSGNDDLIIAKKRGKLVRFNETQIRAVNRASIGVKGVTLEKDDEVVEMVIVKRESDLFFITENGYGKRTRISEFRNTNRGGKGVICIQTGERNGNLVTSREVVESDEVMIITKSGMIIRSPVTGVRVVGRATKGVRIINLKDGDKVVDVALVAGGKVDDDDEPEDDVTAAETEAEGEEEEAGLDPEE
ncbi:MAG: DNA gyrase subunit A [Candidatus Krumholzibacteriota bacterium]|nr:DNA gyrase subunit A [Candidatus Krumholzibacteriota bacterium]